jgi:hypothetical protein
VPAAQLHGESGPPARPSNPSCPPARLPTPAPLPRAQEIHSRAYELGRHSGHTLPAIEATVGATSNKWLLEALGEGARVVVLPSAPLRLCMKARHRQRPSAGRASRGGRPSNLSPAPIPRRSSASVCRLAC